MKPQLSTVSTPQSEKGYTPMRPDRQPRMCVRYGVLISAFLIIGLLLVACRPLLTPTPPASPPAATRPPAAPARPSPTAAASSTAEPGPAASLPGSSLFDVAWTDLTLFRSGLIDAEQSALQQLPGASVYHIEFEISQDLVHVTGREEVLYTNQESKPLHEVYFRLFPNLTGGSMTVSDATVDGAPVEPTYQASNSAMRLPLGRFLQPGQQTVIGMDFAVHVPGDVSSNYGTFAFLNDVLTLAHFYPMIAVYDDEGWDVAIPSPFGDIVYSDSSFYLVRVRAPAAQVLAASGIALADGQRAGDWQETTFVAGPMRDFYLAASSRYAVLSQQVGQTTVNSYAFAELTGAAELVLDYAVDSLESFNARFGVYPFTELDVVGTGTNALGVEYPGIVAITLDAYDESQSTTLEGTTAHEVGHQWFYSVVGNDQVNEPWLDEALVQYATLRYFEDIYGQPGFDGFRQSLVGRWERVEGADIPIGMPVSAYEGRAYGAIVYGRGPLFFEVLQEEMGERTLDGFLRDYYQSQKWGLATTESFKALAEQHCRCDLTALFEAWVYER